MGVFYYVEYMHCIWSSPVDAVRLQRKPGRRTTSSTITRPQHGSITDLVDLDEPLPYQVYLVKSDSSNVVVLVIVECKEFVGFLIYLERTSISIEPSWELESMHLDGPDDRARFELDDNILITCKIMEVKLAFT